MREVRKCQDVLPAVISRRGPVDCLDKHVGKELAIAGSGRADKSSCHQARLAAEAQAASEFLFIRGYSTGVLRRFRGNAARARPGHCQLIECQLIDRLRPRNSAIISSPRCTVTS